MQVLGDVLRLARIGRKREALHLLPKVEQPIPAPSAIHSRDVSLARIPGVDATVGANLVAAGIWTASDLADPAKVEAAGKIDGISPEGLRTLHEAARVALRYPTLTPSETDLAVNGFNLTVPVNRDNVASLVDAPEHEIRSAFGRVALPREFGVSSARSMLKKIAET